MATKKKKKGKPARKKAKRAPARKAKASAKRSKRGGRKAKAKAKPKKVKKVARKSTPKARVARPKKAVKVKVAARPKIQAKKKSVVKKSDVKPASRKISAPPPPAHTLFDRPSEVEQRGKSKAELREIEPALGSDALVHEEAPVEMAEAVEEGNSEDTSSAPMDEEPSNEEREA